MSRTRAETRFKVLAILTGGDVGQEPSGEDAANIDLYINDQIEELDEDRVVNIQDADAIPGGLFLTFCKIVANAAADEYGGKSDEERAERLFKRMRRLAAQTPGYGPQEAEYF